jgi:hypothetical protein
MVVQGSLFISLESQTPIYAGLSHHILSQLPMTSDRARPLYHLCDEEDISRNATTQCDNHEIGGILWISNSKLRYFLALCTPFSSYFLPGAY